MGGEQVRVRDWLERLFWTALAAFLGALSAPPVGDVIGLDISLSALEAAFLAAVSAAVNFLSLVARARLAVLPEPGEGLPGLPVEEP
jgi:hypothetical protein